MTDPVAGPPAVSTEPRGRIAALWTVLVVVLVTVAGFAVWKFPTAEDSQAAAPPPELEVHGTVPPFEFVHHTGQAVSRDDLLGKVWVADFIFTQCGSICPMMTVRMGELQALVGNREDVRYVSISVDPERDSPERLAKYAANYGADWFFLTGSREEIYDLCQTHFRLGVRERTDEEVKKAPDEDLILHSQRFVLVDQEGRIRGYYFGAEKDQLGYIRDDILTLLESGD